jgi:hypothetical protein
MKRVFVTLSLGLLLAFGAGCKKKEEKPADPAAGSAPAGSAADPGSAAAPKTTDTPAPAGDMSMDEACTKSIAMMESMVAAVSSNKGNCDAMGTALEKWAADNKAFMEYGKAMDKDEAKKKEFDEVCKPKMEPLMAKMGTDMAAMGECMTNEKVKAAMSSLE